MLEIIYLSFNRLEFAKESMAALILNTDWSRVGRLVIYDDGSTDGSREHLESLTYPVETEFRRRRLGGPVAVMNDYLARTPGELFCKVDNDTMLPPHWLGECLKVMDARPELDLLGVEAFNAVAPGEISRGYRPARYIGGIGCMRRRCFRTMPKPNGRFGFTQWQREARHAIKGWINPSLPVFLLDKMPMEPWAGFSRDYIARGWQRAWPPYGEADAALWAWREESWR